MKYDDIKPYIEKKLVSEQAHPEDPAVRIFNYTQTCQFAQAWDDVTRQCRGLIMNVETGEIIARPFPKFFNYGEHVSKGWAIPTSRPEIYTKLDGSLGILYALNGKPWIATRGSFTSDQAIWATNWWRDHIAMLPEKGETHLFEIIYPENRIVVAYDFSGLVHLATIDNTTGRTIHRQWGGDVRLPVRYDGRLVDELEKFDEPNSEGFVLFYPEENVRMKVKLPEYVRLHKLITGVNEIAIWEHLRDGIPLQELIDKVPDEFMKWVDEVSHRLVDQYNEIAHQAVKDLEDIEVELYSLIADGNAERKDWALAIQKKKNPGILFAMHDDKAWQPIIWKMVRPHGASAFKTDIDL